MAFFDAGEIIEEIGYDFTRHHGGKGVIPEPTNAQLRTFGRFLDAARRNNDERITAAKAAIEAGDQPAPLDETDAAVQDIEAADAVAAVCSHTPTSEEIQALPSRVQRAFLGYVVGHFMDPTIATVALKRSPAAPTVDAPASS